MSAGARTASPCGDCSEPTFRASGFCGPCIDERARTSRLEQGLPATVVDAGARARIEHLLTREAA